MSAQVRTRLRFRHLGAAAVRAARRTRKSRSSSPPSPRRAAIPSAPTAVAGERRPALESRTRATADPKVPPGHPHPFRAVAGHSLAVSPAPTPPHTHTQKKKTLSQWPVWCWTGAPKAQAPRGCPSRAPAFGLCHWQAAPWRAGSELRGTRPVCRSARRSLTGKGCRRQTQMSASGWRC